MPSSTSSFRFRRRPLHRFAIVSLLGVVSLAALGLEGLSRFGLKRFSGFHQRFEGERDVVLSELRPHLAAPGLLMVGNSLLLEGVNFKDLHNALAPEVRAYRYLIIQTGFYDWYYGLDRLFKQGIRPQYVVLGLSPRQLVQSNIRGDYTAHYLFDLPGILDYSRREHLTPTQTSTLAFANVSALYATRSETRITIMERLLPAYGTALQNLASGANPSPTPKQIAQAGVEHLKLLKDLCADYGAEAIFVLPPAMNPMDDEVREAGQEAGITVLTPAHFLSGDRSQFGPDAVHLHKLSRPVFTTALAQDIISEISSREAPLGVSAADGISAQPLPLPAEDDAAKHTH